MALCTVVVRRKRVDLRDPGHRGDEGGTDRSSRPHQIAVLNGLPDQLLRYDVHNGIPVPDNGIKFPLQPLLNDARQRITVHLVRFVIADLPEHLIGDPHEP